MAITAGDLFFRLSTASGAAGFSTAQGDPNASLGKYMSTTALSGTPANNLFDDVSGAENAASDVEYRCIFVHNTHATLTLTSAKMWIDESSYSGGTTIAIASDNIGVVAEDTAGAQAEEEADESTAPTAVSAFVSPTNYAGGLALGDIGPGQCRGVWVRRTAANTAAAADGVVFHIQGDTAA